MYSETATRELNEELQPRVKAGDESAREQMIVANRPFVAYKVTKFLARCPQFKYLEEDLIAEGLLGLTHAVNTMREEEGDNPTSLIALCIEQHILMAVRAFDGAINVPSRSRRRRPDKLRVPSRVKLNDIQAPDARGVIDLRDTIIACCETPAEQQIVELREAGYTDAEIGEKVGMPRSSVTAARKEIFERFKTRAEI